MTTEERLKLITKNLEEVLTDEELKSLIDSETPLKHYIGFEISGKVHLGTGLMCMQVVKNLHDAGVETTIFLADWHSWINNKLDGTLETPQRLAMDYFGEALKAGYLCLGGNIDDLKFVQGSNLYRENPDFWATTIKVAKATTVARMMRSTTIMGRQSGTSSPTADLFYPAMQAADIYTLGVNIAHAGKDQRNVHVVARDVAKDLKMTKPVAIHHHLLQGLLKPPVWPLPKKNKEELVVNLKMSKSKPDSAIFIHDSDDEIQRKINNAFAPEGEVEFNPILDWTKYLIFYGRSGASSTKVAPQPRSHRNLSATLTIKRDPKYGGNITYNSYEELEKDYAEKKLHPQDLKSAVVEWLVKKLEPARKYFEVPKRKSALEEIEKLTDT